MGVDVLTEVEVELDAIHRGVNLTLDGIDVLLHLAATVPRRTRQSHLLRHRGRRR